MRVIVDTQDFFMGQRILLEVDAHDSMHAVVKFALKRWKAWREEVSKYDVVDATPRMPEPAHPDTARLDWLAAQADPSQIGGRDFAQLVKIHGEWRVEGSVYEGRGPTPREAIDAAMAAAAAARRRDEPDDEDES